MRVALGVRVAVAVGDRVAVLVFVLVDVLVRLGNPIRVAAVVGVLVMVGV